MNFKKIALYAIGAIVFLIVFSLIMSYFFGVKEESPEPLTIKENSQIQKATDIESTLKAWKASGLAVSDDKGALYQILGATDGGKYDVGSTNVEIYEFTDNSKANEAKSSSFNSASDTVIVVGKLLIDIHSTDPSQVNAIKAVF